MKSRPLVALFAPALAAALLSVPARAGASPDPLGAARESFTAFETALAALKPPAYRRQERRLVDERLADLRRKVDAVKLSEAERASPHAAAALDRLRRAVAGAEERERAFWSGPSAAAGAFPSETAETLRRDGGSIRSAFTTIAGGPAIGPGARGAAGPRTANAPPPAASGSVARAQKSAGRSIADPNAFFDGQRTGSGNVVSGRPVSATRGRAALASALPGGRVSDLRVAPVPSYRPVPDSETRSAGVRARRVLASGAPAARAALRAAGRSTPALGTLAVVATNRPAASRSAAPAITSEESACRRVSGGGLVARLCSSRFPMIAPAAAGFGDAFKEQFGTASGWISTAVSLLVGIVLPAVMGGVGILFNVLRAVCGLAVLWAIGALVKNLYDLYREFTSTSPADPRHWLVARRFGAVCGKLLLTIVFTIAGIKIGSAPGVKGALMSGLQSLQAKLVTLAGGTAAPSAMAAQVSGAFGEAEAAPAKPVEPIKPPPPPESRGADEGGYGSTAAGSRFFRQLSDAEKKVVAERRAEFDQNQVQSKFKHAEDFGIKGNANRGTIQEFRAALESHLHSAKDVIAGTYRREPVLHFLDPATRLDVMIKPDGQFLSGWRLNPDQVTNILTRGSL